MKRIRPSTYVEEGNLTQNISLLRKALGETPDGVQFIETVPRRGYRFVAPVTESWENEANPSAPEAGPKEPSESSNSTPVVSIPPASNRFAWFRRTPGFAVAVGAVLITILGLVYFTTWGKAGNEEAIQSIAVLPFVDESADPDAQYIN